MDLLKDNVKRLFYNYLIPAISSAVAVAIYSLIDTIAIGQGVGPNGTAACALVLPIFSIGSFVALICGIGGSVLMSQARGSGNQKKGDAYFTSAIFYVIILTLIVWFFGNLFQEEFYWLCGADKVLMPYAVEYGSWIFAFLPSFVMTTFLGCFLRADGSPRFVMIATLIGGVINIVGDWVFVFPLKMGMKGAAIATVLGSVVQALMLVSYVLMKKSSLKLAIPYKWASAFRKITVIGFSSGISSLAVIAVSFIANNQIMKYAGGTALAVYGVLGTVSALFNSIFSGVGQTAQPIVSQNFGAGNQDRCWVTAKYGMYNAIFFGTIFSIVSIAFPTEIMSIFMKMTPEVKEAAPYILIVYSLSYLPLSVNIFSIYYLQAMMHPQIATAISLLRGILLNGLFLFVFPLFLGGNGIWWAIFGAEIITMFFAAGYVFYLFRKFQSER